MTSEELKESQAENKESKKCSEEICIPPEVRIKYFPSDAKKAAYDILPLFEYEAYKRKLMKETSFLENPEYAAKWKAFQEGLPKSAWELQPVPIESNNIAVFANYRRQRVPPEYYSAFVGPSSPHAIFRRMN